VQAGLNVAGSRLALQMLADLQSKCGELCIVAVAVKKTELLHGLKHRNGGGIRISSAVHRAPVQYLRIADHSGSLGMVIGRVVVNSAEVDHQRLHSHIRVVASCSTTSVQTSFQVLTDDRADHPRQW